MCASEKTASSVNPSSLVLDENAGQSTGDFSVSAVVWASNVPSSRDSAVGETVEVLCFGRFDGRRRGGSLSAVTAFGNDWGGIHSRGLAPPTFFRFRAVSMLDGGSLIEAASFDSGGPLATVSPG